MAAPGRTTADASSLHPNCNNLAATFKARCNLGHRKCRHDSNILGTHRCTFTEYLSHFANKSNLLESARISSNIRHLRSKKSAGLHRIFESFLRI